MLDYESPKENNDPLVNVDITMENHICFTGKSTVEIAIFHSKLLVYQRVYHHVPSFSYDVPMIFSFFYCFFP